MERLIHFWRNAGITLRPPATEASLLSFEGKYGVSLPADMRLYLRSADGMQEGEIDEDLFSFWELGRMRPITEELPEPTYEHYRSFAGAELCFCFADWMFNGDIFCVHLPSHGVEAIRFSKLGPVFLPFASFTEFAAAYLVDANRSLL